MARTPVEELRVLEDNGVNIGLLLARFQRVFWGGRPVPASQISGLSVGVQHRGRGAAGELLRGYLSEAHDRGAAISTLFPATVPLYRRAGYEYAGTWTLYEAAARNLPLGWPEGYHATPGPVDDPTAFSSRGYPSRLRGGLTVRVRDEICPWVDGTWSIEVEQGEGKASRVWDEPH